MRVDKGVVLPYNCNCQNNEEEKEMQSINRMYADFCAKASNIPGFRIGQKEDVTYDITSLANAAVKALDEHDDQTYEAYVSALMVRYWHMVPYLYNQSRSSRLELEDMAMWIYDGLAKAFKYRSWLDPNKAVSKDPKGAEKCFNQCITSVRQYWYKHFNTNASKINYLALSLDELRESLGDSFDDSIPQQMVLEENDSCKDIIQSLIKQDKVLEALVIDRICYGDSFKETTIIDDNGRRKSYGFDERKLLKSFKSINDGYLRAFGLAYGINPQKVKDILVKNAKSKPDFGIKGILDGLRKSKEVISLLC